MSKSKTTADDLESKENLIAYCRENARVCPVPQKWSALWELLPGRRQAGAGHEPAAPLILAAWYDTSNLAKMLRLSEHIEWADKHGSLPLVATFLRSLAESDWHHLKD